MSNGELLLNGFKLMVLGMGVVFAFLVLMVFCMNIVARLLKPFAARFETGGGKVSAPAKPGAADDAAVAAVAAAAVSLFRGQGRSERK